jgi:iron complex outermembrane recepter protein
MRTCRHSLGVLLLGAATVLAGSPRQAAAQSLEELRRLSLEELGDIEITSVSRRPEPLSRAPAAVYVITNEDIRRSGALDLAEALRLAPNLEVARRDALAYAISARGFNSIEASNKLLVLIDGRSVYSPLHSGVFWDQQQVMLEDVDRIEVISGPGGTLYGANAVNGVINVTTKNARETTGALASVQAGNVDRQGAVRWGGRLGQSGAYRVYGMGFLRGHSVTAEGSNIDDDLRGRQGGFRSDWRAGDAAFTLQGDVYENRADGGAQVFNGVLGGGHIFGGNLLGRWNQQLGNGSALEVQTYINRDERSAPNSLDRIDTFDLQAQHNFKPNDRNEVVWGGGHRIVRDKFISTANPFVLDPPGRTLQLSNLFLQDTFALLDGVSLTLGTKVEYSSFNGFNYMPSARLAWQVAEGHLLWSSISRAVRTTSRIDRELVAPGIFAGGPDFKSEKLIAYEIGYRGRPSAATSLSVSAYYNHYDDIRTTSLSPGGGFPLIFANDLEGETHGVEVWGDWRVTSWWRLSGGVNAIEKNLHLKPGGSDISGRQSAGRDPGYQFFARSYLDFPGDVHLDFGFRAVDNLESPPVPAYVEFDARLAWQVTEGIELSIAGFNLIDDHHPETGTLPLSEIRRGGYLGARWTF